MGSVFTYLASACGDLMDAATQLQDLVSREGQTEGAEIIEAVKDIITSCLPLSPQRGTFNGRITHCNVLPENLW